MNEKRKLTS